MCPLSKYNRSARSGPSNYITTSHRLSLPAGPIKSISLLCMKMWSRPSSTISNKPLLTIVILPFHPVLSTHDPHPNWISKATGHWGLKRFSFTMGNWRLPSLKSYQHTGIWKVIMMEITAPMYWSPFSFLFIWWNSPVSLQRPHYLSCQNTDLPLPQIQTPRKDQHYSAPFFKQRLSSSSTVSKSWRIKPSEKKRCESCQTSHSPEWRRGPSGHRTLCNACGLRYSRSRSRQDQRVTLSPIISHSYVQQQQQQQLPFSSFSDDLCTLSSSSTSSSSASSSSASSPSLPQYPQSHAKYPGQRRFFNLYPWICFFLTLDNK